LPYKDPQKRKEQSKRWRENNPEKFKEIQKRYRDNHPEKRQEQKIKWLKDNPNYFKEYNQKHKEKRKQYRKDNIEKVREWRRNWAKNNPDKKKEMDKYYNQNNKEKIKINNRNRILKQYNLTQEDFDKLLNSQNNQCGICKKILKVPYIDHDHTTGEVRGILCLQCNTGLGYLGDNVKAVINTLYYLNKNLY
jgi:hypothetical protein